MTISSPISLVVLISGNGTNLQAIIDEIKNNNLPAHIKAVISNEPSAYGLKRAQKANINTAIVNHREFDSRQAFDQYLAEKIADYTPDLVILAGFMHILGSCLIARFRDRILNIHPSLLPAYKGLHTHQRVLRDGKHKHGSSVHFVTTELDEGPVIVQVSLDVNADDSVDTLQHRVQQLEYKIYPFTIRLFAEGRISLVGGQIYINGELHQQPLQFTAN